MEAINPNYQCFWEASSNDVILEQPGTSALLSRPQNSSAPSGLGDSYSYPPPSPSPSPLPHHYCQSTEAPCSSKSMRAHVWALHRGKQEGKMRGTKVKPDVESEKAKLDVKSDDNNRAMIGSEQYRRSRILDQHHLVYNSR
ncbi:hypothetical protein C8J56DRAFT_1168170 [Mycena floridula]|nr:hypothetical protein C8J56DRAFT_1168170 [Mycena floridula]